MMRRLDGRALLAWFVAWSAWAALITVAIVVGQRWHDLAWVWGQALLGFTLAVLGMLAGRRAIRWILVLFCWTLIAAGVVELVAAPHRWYGQQTLSLSKVLHSTAAAGDTRRWRVGAGERPTLTFRARLIAGYPGWRWNSTVTGTTVAPYGEGGPSAAAVTVPAAGAIYRSYALDERAGGRTFRAVVELRGFASDGATGCVGLVIRASAGSSSDCASPASPVPSGSWVTVSQVWTSPADATSRIVSLQLWPGDPRPFEVRNARLSERVGGAWRPLPPSLTSGAGLVLSREVADGQQPSVRVPLPQLTSAWSLVSIPVPPSFAPGTVAARWFAPSGTVVETAAVRLPGATPLPATSRASLLTAQPNLGGHALTTSSLALLAVGAPVAVTATTLAAALWAILRTQSRTAWAIFLTGSFVLLLLDVRARSPWRRRATSWLLAGTLVVAAAATMIFVQRFGPTHLSGGDRTLAWQLSIQSLVHRPWTGIDQAEFQALWSATTSDPPVDHSHDLVLDAARRWGVPGALASLWLMGWLAWWSWRSLRWRGLVLVGAVMALNAVDLTLYYAGVFYPFVLALASSERSASGRRDPR